jgi:enamine deaminase RidA (YjgF/YER057c/UK114 family)
LEIIGTALIEAGGNLDDVVRTRIFVADFGDFDEVARANRELFGGAVTPPDAAASPRPASFSG